MIRPELQRFVRLSKASLVKSLIRLQSFEGGASAQLHAIPHAWMTMDDKDHVFARFTDDKPASAERRETRNIPRRAGAPGNRVVEVVHVRSGRVAKEGARRVDAHVRAASWDGGFPAKQTATAFMPVEPVAAEAELPVTHVMPAWEPTAGEVEAVPPAQAPVQVEESIAPVRRGRGRPRKAIEVAPARGVADPFDTADDGANCMRCGYAIEPAREQRGLMTCAGCG